MVIVTTKELAEVWISKDIWDQMSREKKNEANKLIHEAMTSMVSYEPNPYQPERLNPETPKGEAIVRPTVEAVELSRNDLARESE